MCLVVFKCLRLCNVDYLRFANYISLLWLTYRTPGAIQSFWCPLERIWHRFWLLTSLRRNWRANPASYRGLWRNSERIWLGLFGIIQLFRRPFKHIRPGQVRHRTELPAIWNTFWDRLNAFGRPPALLTPSIRVFSIFRNAFGRCSGLLAYFATHLTLFETHLTSFETLLTPFETHLTLFGAY